MKFHLNNFIQIKIKKNFNDSTGKICNLTHRYFQSLNYKSNKEILTDKYNKLKAYVDKLSLPGNVDKNAIFANNELDLKEIEVFGFDYDYTLAVYKDSLLKHLYNLGRSSLIKDYKYPKELAYPKYDFKTNFASRGLHCDVVKGYLMKIDAYHNIQQDSVYLGWRKVPKKNIFSTYNGFHINSDMLSGYYGTGPKMYQLMDRFSIAEITLLASVNEFFISEQADYCPENVFYDIRHAIRDIHKSGLLYETIHNNFHFYMEINNRIPELLTSLKEAGKKTFLITNSPVDFVGKGLKKIFGDNWLKSFDLIITKASKPKFFTDSIRHFRMFDDTNQNLTWKKVEKFEKGRVYLGGNLNELIKLTGWAGHNVLYIGDHVYADLLDATMRLGWRTGAVIPELCDEISVLNSEEYKRAINWSFALDKLISQMQIYDNFECREVVQSWLEERNLVRRQTRNLFNPRFGSIFRTYHNATFFSSRLRRYADVYMSCLSNFLNYSLKHTFYPRRSALPHEKTYNLLS